MTDSTQGERALKAVDTGPDLPVGAAFVPPDSGLEVVGATGALVRLGMDGRRLGEAAFHVPVRLQAAVRTRSGWVGGGVDSSGTYFVFRMLGGRVRLLLAVTRDTSSSGAAAVQLAADGDRVLVTDLEEPFQTRVLGADGAELRRFAPADPPPAATAGSTRRRTRWISLPVVPLGDGYLQTLSDLGSDRRVMVLYGADGGELRRRAVEVPLAISGITPGLGYLLAARNAGDSEVVVYSWRWKNSEPGGG